MGIVYESMQRNYQAARQCYEAVQQHWPMSPMADQARSRLMVLARYNTSKP
jgi:hypothetical protein